MMTGAEPPIGGMMRSSTVVWLLIVISAIGAGWFIAAVRGDDGDRTDDVRKAIQSGTARNVILFIGDDAGIAVHVFHSRASAEQWMSASSRVRRA